MTASKSLVYTKLMVPEQGSSSCPGSDAGKVSASEQASLRRSGVLAQARCQAEASEISGRCGAGQVVRFCWPGVTFKRVKMVFAERDAQGFSRL